MSTVIALTTLLLAGLDLAVFGGAVMAEVSEEAKGLLRTLAAFLRR